MTTVYFIRHAKSDETIHDDAARPLTQKGLNDRKLVTEYLSDKKIDLVFSSPYLRAVDTIKEFADQNNLPITLIDDFRERRVDSIWIEDFWSYIEKQWREFDYKFTDGECLREVRERNIMALNKVLNKNENKNIVIGTHGTALSQIIHYYDNTFGFDDFMAMVHIMPFVVIMKFNGTDFIEMKKVNLFDLKTGD